MPHLEETGAQSIGLFRTELQFMLAAASHASTPRNCCIARVDAAGDTGHFSHLDIGGDKMLPYMKRLDEANPALGCGRSALASTAGPAAHQLRAMLRAAAPRAQSDDPDGVDGPEFLAARVVRTRARLPQALGREPPCDVKLAPCRGAVAVMGARRGRDRRRLPLGRLNDLMQYVFAADRANKRSPVASTSSRRLPARAE